MSSILKRVISRYYLYLPLYIKKLLIPRNIVVEPIAGCNVECVSCPQDILKREKGDMGMDTFMNIIEKVKPRSMGMYFMGEPFLNRRIFVMLRIAKELGIRTIINTNGTTLFRDCKKIVDSGLSRLVISMDGFNQEFWEKYRKGIGNVNLILHGIIRLCAYNDGSLSIGVRTLNFDYLTVGEKSSIDWFCSLVGVSDHRYITPIVGNWGSKNNKDDLGEGRVLNNKPNVCPSIFRMVFTWEGEVLPCCNDVHGECSFGNINDRDYEDIVFGSDMYMRKTKREFDICERCI